MKHRFSAWGASPGWRTPTKLMLAAVLGLSALGSGAVSVSPHEIHAQPLLLQMAAQQPDQKVNIIVQTTGKADGPEKLVARLGGTVTKDLHIINAFAASVTAKDVAQIGKSNEVRWVSFDAAVSQSSMGGQFTTWATGLGTATNASVSASFNSYSVPQGKTLWFNSAIVGNRLGTGVVHFTIDTATIQFSANGATFKVQVPDAYVTYDPAATTSTTTFDNVHKTWNTTVPPSQGGSDVFAAGVAYVLPQALPANITNVTWTARITCNTPGVTASWKWATAAYSSLSPDFTSLNVKPISASSGSSYLNGDRAGTPENYKTNTIAGGTGPGGTNYTGSYASSNSPTVPTLFANAPKTVDAASGPNGTYGSGGALSQTFNGFMAEVTPGNAITKVEVALRAYTTAALSSTDIAYVTASLSGTLGSSVGLNPSSFSCCDPAHASTIYVDVTNTRAWRWSDFKSNLQLTVDQTRFARGHIAYYDAVGYRVTSGTGTDSATGGAVASSSTFGPSDTSRLSNVYNSAVRATDTWNEGPAYLQGQNMTVAVVDSGDFNSKDYASRIIADVNFDASYHTSTDKYGHGTFVSGVIAGAGTLSNGAYMGIAPQSNIVTVRVSDDQGMSTESTVVNGLQWINDNKAAYNIKVVNLSLNSGVAQSYNTSPLDAAVEILWFNGITVITSAGNNGTANLYAPANDPFVITVGATNDQGTTSLADDAVAPFSAYGTDEIGNAKPDIVAPGTNLIAPLPDVSSLTIPVNHPANVVNNYYFRMSGTSMSAPIVAGAALLLLQDEPNLTPDQVKYRLKATANHDRTVWPGYNPITAGAGYLDIYAAVHGATTVSANTGLRASQLLWTGSTPVTWGSVNWNSVNWNSVNWNSVNWNSVNWNSVNWNSDFWGTNP